MKQGVSNMALRIRLKRNGRNKLPVYRVVVTERRWWRNGKMIDDLGSYDPRTDKCIINVIRVQDWLLKGATMTRSAERIINEALDAYQKIEDAFNQEPFQ